MVHPRREDAIPRIERYGTRTIPAHRYTDPSFASLEHTRVFSRGWIAACPGWRVAAPGSFATLNEAGISIVVTRDQKGRLHAFRNSCRHRGSRIADGCGTATALKCGYHGWTYGLDGRLQTVPDRGGFGDVCLDDVVLASVRHAHVAGLIWVNLNEDADALEDAMKGMAEELAPYRLDQMRPIQSRVFSIPVNWKVMIENAMDFYHVAEVHRQTVFAHVDHLPELAIYGDHTRQNVHIAPYRWRSWLDHRCSRAGPYTDRQQSQLFKYTLFPNTMLNVLPYHLTIMRFWPDGPGRTRLHYDFCLREGARGVEWARAWATWAASRVILAEDVRMLSRCQRDLDTDAVTEHVLHDHEAAAAHFHRVLGRWTGDEKGA